MLNRDNVIQKQLTLTEKTKFNSGGHNLELTPAKLIPVPNEAKKLLEGNWAVKYYPFNEKSDINENTDNWQKISQPGKVFYADPEGEKNDIPNWNRVSLDHIDEKDGAILVKKVTVPPAWTGKIIFLRFEGIYPGGFIFVNGKKRGEHYSGLTPVEFRLDDIKAGDDITIAVRLLRKHKFVKMDMPRHALEFAGISQSAYLFAVPDCFVKDYHLITELEQSLTNGVVRGTVTIENPPSTGTISVSLLDNKKVVAEYKYDLEKEKYIYAFDLKIEKPKLWNDESPNLYDIQIKIPNCQYSYRTGFRRLDLSPNDPKLNGKFIKFRGVNHLTFHPHSGMYTPKEWLKKCLSLMKKANVNAIRTHFTGPGEFVDLCDEMGFYLLQEIPIDWGTNYIHDPEWVGPAMMRIESIIRRDRHHPSVMVWSVGNENMPESAKVADDGWNHLQTYDEFCKVLDPSRPTMFPPPGPANKIEGIFELRVGDIADIHYSFILQKKFRETGCIENPNSWEGDMVSISYEQALARGWSGCWFSSEYGIFNAFPDILRGPYLSVISDKKSDPMSGQNSMEVFTERIREEWGNMRFDPSCLGGAYFPWLCCGAGSGTEGNPWGWTRWGEDANWGVVTADLLPKPQFWALRVLFSPVWFPERIKWETGAEKVCFKITNQYNSIDLNECIFRTQLNPGATYCSMMRKFKDITVDCPPGETVDFSIPLAQNLQNALTEGNWVLCRITMLDPDGFNPVTAEMQIVPKQLKLATNAQMPVGPDAII